jgi:excisionase family DNA binding protein
MIIEPFGPPSWTSRLSLDLDQSAGVMPVSRTPSGGGRLLLTVEAAAELLSLGRTTVYELVSTGELESVKIGRSRRVPYDALRRYVDRLPYDLDGATVADLPAARAA